MDDDQNNDLSDGQLDHNVDISQYVVVVMEEEQNLEQLEVNCHEEQVKMNCLEEIQHFEIGLVWSCLEYERTSPYHIQDQFCAYYGQAIPKV